MAGSRNHKLKKAHSANWNPSCRTCDSCESGLPLIMIFASLHRFPLTRKYLLVFPVRVDIQSQLPNMWLRDDYLAVRGS